MYERYFKLASNPFSLTPDPGMLFLTEAHRESLAGLNFVVMGRKGFVVLVGEAGTGKTTLLRKLVSMLPPEKAHVCMVFNPTLTAPEFLETLLLNFGLRGLPQSKAQRLHLLGTLLTDADRAGAAPLLVIDEAHQLNFEVLEEIRLLANFETSSHKLLQIVLCGQPELHDLLNRPELRQLKQRIAIRLRVRPLTPDEVAEYICHRWHQARATGAPPFTEAAIQLIARQSRGIPRLINSICDNALLLAFSETSATVSDELIARVSRDLDLDGAAPISCPSPALAEPELTAPNFASLRTLQRDMRREERHFLGIRWAIRAKRAAAGIGR